MDYEFGEKLIRAMSRFIYLSNESFAYKGISFVGDPKSLTATQQQFLIKLRNEGCVRMSQIAEYLVIKRPNATRFASELIRLGWCEKMRQGDKRHVYLVLSESGKARLAENTQKVRDYYMQLLSDYTTHEEQVKMLDFYQYVNQIFEKFPR